MDIFKDCEKIINQIRGSKNMFGYETTLANQFELMHCALGKILFIDQISRQTKLVILFAAIADLLIALAETLFHLFGLYDDLNDDILLMLYTIFIILFQTSTLIITPYLAVFKYHDEITSMIQMVDKINTKQNPSERVNLFPLPIINADSKFDLRKLTVYVIAIIWLTVLPFTIIGAIDMAFFYTEEKVKTYTNYIIPLPKLDKYGSVKLYVIVNTLVITPAPLVYVIGTIMVLLPVQWAAVCHNEINRIVSELNLLSKHFDHTTKQSYRLIEFEFKQTIAKCVEDYHDVIRTIKLFQDFYQAIANSIFPAVMAIEIVHAYVFTTADYSDTVKAKEIFAFISTIAVVCGYCWAGETLQQLTWTLSFAVYSTPWYCSTKVRKDVHVLLCQAQHKISPTTLNIYPLSFSTFSKYMNAIQSCLGILRVLITKK